MKVESIERSMRASYRTRAFNRLEETWINHILTLREDEKITDQEMEALIDLNHTLARAAA